MFHLEISGKFLIDIQPENKLSKEIKDEQPENK